MHKKSEHPDLPDLQHMCDICGKKMHSKYSVVRHKQSVHSHEMRYECNVCGKKYNLVENLKRHEATHGKPLFQCQVCSLSDRKLHFDKKFYLSNLKSFSETT